MNISNLEYCAAIKPHYCDYERPADWWKADTSEDTNEGVQNEVISWKISIAKEPTVEEQFKKLSAKWKSDIGPQSTTVRLVTHQAYLDIIKLGPDVIPYILRDLQKEPNHWFIALRALANNFSPVKPEDAGNIKKMTKAWLKWGREHGKID